MKNNLHSILKDLYIIDPALKDQEKELKQVIQKLLDSKPDLKIDETFVKQLKKQLDNEAYQLTHNPSDLNSNPSPSMFKKIFFPFMGGVLATALVITVISMVRPEALDSEMASENGGLLAMNTKIVEVEPGAFGPLSEFDTTGEATTQKSASFGGSPQIDPSRSTSETGAVISNPISPVMPPVKQENTTFVAPVPAPTSLNNGVGMDAEEQATSEVADTSSSTMGSGGSPTVDQKMIVDPDYVPTVYKYVYKGEPISLAEATVNVFKRIPQKASANSLATAIRNFGFGLMDLASFNNLDVQNVSLKQDQDMGYMMDINFNESSISLYQNWERWTYPGQNCGDDMQCYENSRLKESDIPSDEELISIASDFLSENGINRSNYGEPMIQKYWERDMRIATQQGLPAPELYIPDTINLIYPLVLNGEAVSDQWGNPTGLNVGVNIYHKEVASVYGLRGDQFQSSAYPAIQEWGTIADYLAKGGTPYPIYFEAGQYNEKEVEVGVPEMVLVSVWDYSENNGQGSEFYTPALKFPIIQPEGEYIYQENVVVPLAQELLENVNNGGGMPMPFIKTAEDSEGSAPAVDEPATTPVVPRG